MQKNVLVTVEKIWKIPGDYHNYHWILLHNSVGYLHTVVTRKQWNDRLNFLKVSGIDLFLNMCHS